MLRAIYYQAKKHKLVIIASVLLGMVMFSHSAATVQAATTCPTDTSRGTVTGTFTVTTSSTQTYRVYSRMTVPSPNTAGDNTYVLKIDGTCYNVGGSSVPAYTSTNSNWDSKSADWIDTESGSTTPIDISLAPGSHTYEMIGNADNVRVDRVIFTQENGTPGTCVPVGVGDNCANDVGPTVSITSPTSGTVSGTVTVTATADDSAGVGTVSKVVLSVNGTAETTNMTNTSGSTYTYSLDTTKLTNGTNTLVATAYDPGENSTPSSSVGITVNNQAAPVCSSGGTVSVPGGVTVQQDSTNKYTALDVSWTASTPSSGCTISGYNVYRDGSTTPVNGSTLITGTSYVDNGGFTAGTAHSYTVQGVDTGTNKSAKSTPAVSNSTVADNVAPNLPTNLAAAASTTSTEPITLTWTASTDNPSPGGVGVKNYNIYRSTTNAANSFATLLGTSTTTSYSDTTVSPSTEYFYEIAAVDNNGNASANTTSVHATTMAATCSANPTAPTLFHSTAQTNTTIALAWTGSTPSAGCTLAGYHIYRSDVSATTPLATVTSGTSYTDSGLAPSVSYTYTITAFDSSGHSSAPPTPTSPATIATTPDTTAPSAPGSVTATALSSGKEVDLKWTASTDTGGSGLAGYDIYRSDISTTTPVATVGATTLTYSDTTVKPSTSYVYIVSAVDGAGNQTKITATPNPIVTPAGTVTTAPSPPTSFKPTVATQSANITWTPSTDTGGSGVAGYHVYVNGVLDTYNNNEGTTTTASYTAACLAPNANYTLTVKAFDANGNVSSPATVSFTTSAGGFEGDLNCTVDSNGLHVDSNQLFTLLRNWNSSTALPTDGDIGRTGDKTVNNPDAVVNSADLFDLLRNWGT